MKLSNLIKSLYQQVFIGIVVQKNQAEVCVHRIKGKKLEKELSQSFDITQAKPSAELNAFVERQMQESPFSYVAVLSDIKNQGALPTCSMHEAENFSDLSSCVTLCSTDSSMVYAEKSELTSLQKRFHKNGLDFIFSPFLILSHFFEEKLDGKTALFVLIQKDSLSLSIFNEGKLLFSKYILLSPRLEPELMQEEHSQMQLDMDLDFDEEEDTLSIDLDDIDALDELDALDDLDNLQDLDDLDDIDDIEDFEESLSEAVEQSEIALEEAKVKHESKGENFGDDYKHFQTIQKTLSEFYADEKYNNQFVEEIYIATACEGGQELVRFLEEELFVSVFKRQINLEKELVQMAIREVKA